MKKHKLLRQRQPIKNESLLGYLLRLAELNFFPKMTWLFDLADIPRNGHYKAHKTLLFHKFDLSGLSYLTGVEIQKLESMRYQSVDNKYLIFFSSKPINITLIHALQPRLCPCCLEINNFYHIGWDLAIITCCPIHRCLLVDKCQKCGKKISWRRNKIRECICGFDFTKTKGHPVSHDEASLAAHIYNMLNFENTICSPLSNPLGKLSLKNLAQIILFFCRDFENDITNGFSIFYPKSYDLFKIHTKISNAVKIFSKWPINFHNFLRNTKFRVPKKNESHFGLFKDFGVLYSNLNSKYFSLFPFLEDAFGQYVIKNYPLSILVHTKWYNKRDELNKYVRLSEAARVLNTTEEWICRLLKTGKLVGSYQLYGSRHRYLIDKKSLYRLKENYKNTYSLAEIADRFGIHTSSAQSLVNAGFFEAIRGPATDGYLKLLVSKQSVSELLLSIDAKLGKVENIDKNQIITFTKVYYSLNRIGVSLPNIISAILTNKIRPVLKSKGKGLYTYRFLKRDIVSFYRNSIKKLRKQDITLKQFSNQISSYERAIYFIAKKKFIKTYDSGNLRVGRLVTHKAIEKFNSTYVFSVEIAKICNVNPNTVLAYLKKANIRPVSGPNVDGGFKYLFKRKDIDNFDLSSIKPSRRAKNRLS